MQHIKIIRDMMMLFLVNVGKSVNKLNVMFIFLSELQLRITYSHYHFFAGFFFLSFLNMCINPFLLACLFFVFLFCLQAVQGDIL